MQPDQATPTPPTNAMPPQPDIPGMPAMADLSSTQPATAVPEPIAEPAAPVTPMPVSPSVAPVIDMPSVTPTVSSVGVDSPAVPLPTSTPTVTETPIAPTPEMASAVPAGMPATPAVEMAPSPVAPTDVPVSQPEAPMPTESLVQAVPPAVEPVPGQPMAAYDIAADPNAVNATPVTMQPAQPNDITVGHGGLSMVAKLLILMMIVLLAIGGYVYYRLVYLGASSLF